MSLTPTDLGSNRTTASFVAGHRHGGDVAICGPLLQGGTAMSWTGRADELDLLRSGGACSLFAANFAPDVVCGRRAKVGGIWPTGTYPADSCSRNLKIQNHWDRERLAPWGAPAVVSRQQLPIYPKFGPPPADPPRNRCYRAILSPPTPGMRTPRSPASNSAGPCSQQARLDAIKPDAHNLMALAINYHPPNSHLCCRPLDFAASTRPGKPRGAGVTCWGSGNRAEFLHVDASGRCGAFALEALASRRSPRRRSRSAAFLNVPATGLDLPNPGSFAGLGRSRGLRGEHPLGTRASPMAPRKKTTRRQQAGGLGGRPGIPLAEGLAPDRPGPMPLRVATDGHPFAAELASWPSIEGLISAIQVGNGKWTATANGCFCSSSFNPIASKKPHVFPPGRRWAARQRSSLSA